MSFELHPAPPDERLVESVATELGISTQVVRGWLSGERKLHGEMRERALAAVWRPIRSDHGQHPRH